MLVNGALEPVYAVVSSTRFSRRGFEEKRLKILAKTLLMKSEKRK